MTDRLSLRRAHIDLTAVIRASEEWHPSYKGTPRAFKALVKAEAVLQSQAGEYLYDLSLRAYKYVDWTEYARELAKKPSVNAAAIHADAVATASDAVWKGEAVDLSRYIVEAINIITAIGVDAAIERYGLPLYVDSIQDFVALAAEKHVAGLVSGVTETTRDKIRLSIKQSLSRGETTSQAIERLQSIINNPVRAEMIAQTESVNAWSQGQYNYAKETGAKYRIWEALAGACKLCSPLDGEKVDIDQPFSNGAMLPANHPRCRCSVFYNY